MLSLFSHQKTINESHAKLVQLYISVNLARNIFIIKKMKTKSNDGMKPIFIIFQVLALYPLPNQTIYTIFTIASFTVGFWMLLSLLVISPVFVKGSLRVFMGHIVFILRAILPMVVIAQVYFTRTEQKRIFVILNEVDEAFEKKFSKCINYKRLRIKYFVSFFLPTLTLAIIRTYFIYHLMYHKDANFRFYWFHCVQSLFVSRIRCIQTAFYANLINDRIQWIHQELAKTMQRESLSRRNLQIKIVNLRQIYAMIYDISMLINKSFGWSLLVINISYFVDYVGCSYQYLLVIQGILPMDNGKSALVGLISTSIAFITLCYSCGRCAANVSVLLQNYITKLVHTVGNLKSVSRKQYHSITTTTYRYCRKAGTLHVNNNILHSRYTSLVVHSF